MRCFCYESLTSGGNSLLAWQASEKGLAMKTFRSGSGECCVFATSPLLAAGIHCSHGNHCVSLWSFDFICYRCSDILRRLGKRKRIRVRGSYQVFFS